MGIYTMFQNKYNDRQRHFRLHEWYNIYKLLMNFTFCDPADHIFIQQHIKLIVSFENRTQLSIKNLNGRERRFSYFYEEKNVTTFKDINVELIR